MTRHRFSYGIGSGSIDVDEPDPFDFAGERAGHTEHWGAVICEAGARAMTFTPHAGLASIVLQVFGRDQDADHWSELGRFNSRAGILALANLGDRVAGVERGLHDLRDRVDHQVVKQLAELRADLRDVRSLVTTNNELASALDKFIAKLPPLDPNPRLTEDHLARIFPDQDDDADER